MSRAIFAFTAVIGTLLNGYVAAAILGEANRLTVCRMKPTYHSDPRDFWQYVGFLSLILVMLGFYGSRRI